MTRILISGAGIAGLTSALWFRRLGFDVTVIERAASIRGGGYLVSLSDYAFRAADELNVLPLLQERNMGISHSSYHNMEGTRLLALDYGDLFDNVDVLQIMRDDVVEVLYEVARSDIDCRFGETIETLEQQDSRDGVDVVFQSGANERFDLVVVAEGQNSPTRQLVLAEETYLDYLGLHCAAMPVSNVLGISHKFETHMDLGRYMATFNSPDGNLGSVFVWSDNDPDVANENRLEVLHREFQDSSEAIATVLANADPEDIYMDSLKQVVMQTWQKGRVICIGDAAHCLTLFSGRGAAAAISGATRLVKHIEQKGISEGLLSYEVEMRGIMEPIQKQTRRAVGWYVPQNRAQQLARDFGMRMLPNKLFQTYFQIKYSNV